MAMVCAIPLQKTHSITFESRQVCYPSHRWCGRNVLTRRAGGDHAEMVFLCKLPEAQIDAMLVEIPKWMFDAAHCATLRVTEGAHVDCAALCTSQNSIAAPRVSAKAS